MIQSCLFGNTMIHHSHAAEHTISTALMLYHRWLNPMQTEADGRKTAGTSGTERHNHSSGHSCSFSPHTSKPQAARREKKTRHQTQIITNCPTFSRHPPKYHTDITLIFSEYHHSIRRKGKACGSIRAFSASVCHLSHFSCQVGFPVAQ